MYREIIRYTTEEQAQYLTCTQLYMLPLLNLSDLVFLYNL